MEARTNRHSYPALRIASLIALGVVMGDCMRPPGPVVLPLFFSLLCVVLGFMLWCRDRAAWNLSFLTGLLCILAGMVKVVSDRDTTIEIPDLIVNRKILVSGTIDDWPRCEDRRASFLIRSDAVALDTVRWSLPLLLNVTVLRARGDSLLPHLQHGTKVLLRGQFSLPRKARNPGESSEALFCEVNGVAGFLFVRGEGNIHVVGESSRMTDLRRIVTPIRTSMLNGIDRMIGGEEGEFLKGLLIGERGGIPNETREAFALAGVAHILAVSGSNVAVIAAFLLAALNLIRLPGIVRSTLVGFGLIGYMVVTGSQPPVVRATIMALAFLLGRGLQRKPSAYNTLGLAGLLMLCIDARQVLDIGFQLSFGAVFSILYFYPRLMRGVSSRAKKGIVVSVGRTLWGLASVTLAATFGTLPFIALYFGRVSLVGFLTNLLVVPLSGVCVVLGCVTFVAESFSPWVAEAYASLNWILLRLLLVVTKYCGSLPFAAVDAYGFRMVYSLPYYALLFFVFSWGQPILLRVHLSAFLVSANVLMFLPDETALDDSKAIRVTILDVGQGDAILCDLPGGKHMLIDAGPASATYDAGRRIIVPYLKRRAIDTLHLLVVTHGHADHTGGIASLARAVSIQEVMVPSRRLKTKMDSLFSGTPNRGRPVTGVGMSGMIRRNFPGVRIYVLNPDSPQPDDTSATDAEEGNNASVVLKLGFGETSFLFCGDAEAPVEDRLVVQFGGFLKSGVLKVAHHGSASGTTFAFLSTVGPEICVMSVGRNNSFGHPSSVVVRRLEDSGCLVHRTDESGAAAIESDGKRVSLLNWR